MRDYRTWWVQGKGIFVHLVVLFNHEFTLINNGKLADEIDFDEQYCMMEQLWAIREKLA